MNSTTTLTPTREAPEGPTLLARAAGTPSSENDYLSTAEWNENPGSEPVLEQPKNPVVSVVFDSSAPILPCDSNVNARDTGLGGVV